MIPHTIINTNQLAEGGLMIELCMKKKNHGGLNPLVGLQRGKRIPSLDGGERRTNILKGNKYTHGIALSSSSLTLLPKVNIIGSYSCQTPDKSGPAKNNPIRFFLSGLCFMEINMLQLSAFGSYSHGLKVPLFLQCGHKHLYTGGTTTCNFPSANQRHRLGFTVTKQEVHRQNVDLPPILPKKKKKPYPIPFKTIQKAARDDKKLAEMGREKHLEPPKNGLLVPGLVPVAYEVLNSWKLLIKGLAQLLHVIPVYGCRECSEVHVGLIGHQIQDCHGPNSGKRRGLHSWVKGSIDDVLTPIESYHVYDPFGRRIKHETRFNYDRIPAVVELCIQAGVEVPEYPSRRRSSPIRMIGKKVIDRGGFADEPVPWKSGASCNSCMEFDTHDVLERFSPPQLSDVPVIAQETLDAYEGVRLGLRKLMDKYSVKACGYCSEVHVGPWGHNAKLCGEFKHQWRDGKHGWQDATIDEVLPPNYVWHVRDSKGPPLRTALKRFYGKAPMVVELCMQAGAEIPNYYKSMMRLDIVLPDSDEASLVA